MATLTEATIADVANNHAERPKLTAEDIERLLKEAEDRLRTAEELNKSQRKSDTSLTNPKPLPKLSTQLSREPYVQKKNGIAIADPARLVDRDQRRLADQEHYVESVEKNKKAVSRTFLLYFQVSQISKHDDHFNPHSNCRPARSS